jgi:hypothetical protein
MLVAGPPPMVAEGVTAVITVPVPGATVTKMVQVHGTATWPGGAAMYFKVEIQGPQFPGWTTIGSTHSDQVANGYLDQFGAEGLQPGIYKLRIAIIGSDAGVLATSNEVPVNITGQ